MDGQSRVRMNVSLTAKGQAQWDVTAEFASPEESEKALRESISKVRGVIKESNLVEVGSN